MYLLTNMFEINLQFDIIKLPIQYQQLMKQKWMQNLIDHWFHAIPSPPKPTITINLLKTPKMRSLLHSEQVNYPLIILESNIQMSSISKKTNTSHHESKILLDTCVYTDVKFKHSSQSNDIDLMAQRQEKLKKDLAFWNSMVDGKIESLSSCINLLILLLILSLASPAYNGPDTNGAEILGWICVALVCFLYVVILCIKLVLIPWIEQQNNSEGFRLYSDIEKHKQSMTDLSLAQLELLQHVVTTKLNLFVKCFPHTLPNQVITEIRNVLNSRSDRPYQPNNALKELKKKEKNARWWQSFWQVFILGKAFSVPGVVLLVFIITPLSIATKKLTSASMNNAQGWLAVGFLGFGFLLFALIKLFLWDYLNNKVESAKCDVLQLFHSINLKHKTLNSLNLPQLESLQKLLQERSYDFRLCFPEANLNQILEEVHHLISAGLPNKGDNNDEAELLQVISNGKRAQALSTAWTAFFNQRLITTIINILKCLIVIAITFIPNYSQTPEDAKDAKIAVGSIGVLYFVLGYCFYLFLRAYYLDHLETVAHKARSSPFTTFRLVYFGNKKLHDLQHHEIEDICEGFDQRKEDFLRCFPSIDPQAFQKELHEVVEQKLEHHYDSADQVYDLLQKQSQARKTVNFWSSYADNPLMTSMYSVYVLLVLILVTIAEVYDGVSKVMGWFGVATLALLVVLVFAIKIFVIDYKNGALKALHVPGYSQYSLVYNKTKQLNSLQVEELHKIQQIIETNPVQFRKCFPKTNLTILHEVKALIAGKSSQLHEIKTRSSLEQVRHQIFTLQVTRCKNALSAWTSLIMEKIYAITQLSIVVNILWVQSIATTLYGLTVCGFLAVASLAVIGFLVLFFNCYYREHLQNKIAQCQHEIKGLEKKKEHSISSP